MICNRCDGTECDRHDEADDRKRVAEIRVGHGPAVCGRGCAVCLLVRAIDAANARADEAERFWKSQHDLSTEEAERVRRQLATIVDEAFGLQPVMTADELLTFLEQRLFADRVEAERLTASVSQLREAGDALRERLALVAGEDLGPIAAWDRARGGT